MLIVYTIILFTLLSVNVKRQVFIINTCLNFDSVELLPHHSLLLQHFLLAVDAAQAVHKYCTYKQVQPAYVHHRIK